MWRYGLLALCVPALFLTAASSRADEKAAGLIEAVLHRVQTDVPAVAETQILCRYRGETWTIQGKSIQYQPLSARKTPHGLYFYRGDSVNHLSLLFPSATFLALSLYGDPLITRAPYEDKQAAGARTLPDETRNGAAYKVLELNDPLLSPHPPLQMPLPALERVKVRWYIGEDSRIHRITGEFKLPGKEGLFAYPLTLEANISYRKPHTGPERPPSAPPIRTLEIPGQGKITALAGSPDGKLFAAAGTDGAAHLWNTTTWKEAALLADPQNRIGLFAFSADSRRLATASRDFGNSGPILVWDLTTGKKIQTLPIDQKEGGIASLSFSPDGRYLATGSPQTKCRVWDAATGKQVWEGPHDGSSWVLFTPNGKWLVTADFCSIRIWDTLRWSEVQLLSPPTLGGAWPGIPRIAVSPDSKFLALGDSQSFGSSVLEIQAAKRKPGVVWIWETETGRLVHTLEGAIGSIRAIAFSPDGRILAAGDQDDRGETPIQRGAVVLWDTTTWKALQTIAVDPDHSAGSIAFAGNLETLATTNGSSILQLWAVPLRP